MCDSHSPKEFWAESGVTWAIVEGSCDNHKTRREVTWRETKLFICTLCHSHMIGDPFEFSWFSGICAGWVAQECFIQREKFQPPQSECSKISNGICPFGGYLAVHSKKSICKQLETLVYHCQPAEQTMKMGNKISNIHEVESISFAPEKHYEIKSH
jgi:hypothetical protein